MENIEEEGKSEIDVLISALEKKGIVIARYRNEVLDLWSDNSFELPQVYDKNTFDLPFVFFQNKWFVLGEKKIADVYGKESLPIKSVEDVENLIVLKDGEQFGRYLEILYLAKLILVDKKSHWHLRYPKR